MALVEVARFLDMPEAQVAASALRASDIHVLVQNEAFTQTQGLLLFAFGGVRLWVYEADAADAQAYLKTLRAQPSAIEPLAPLESAAWMGASILAFLLGVFAPFRPRRWRRENDDPAP